jgi:hypothetical protein
VVSACSQEYQGADGTRLEEQEQEQEQECGGGRGGGSGDQQRLPSQLEAGMQCRVVSAKLHQGATSVPG